MSEDTPTSTPLDLSSLRLMPDWVANFGHENKHRSEERDGLAREERPRRDDRRDGSGRSAPGGHFRDRNDRGDRRDGGPRRPNGGPGGKPGFRRDRDGHGAGRDRFPPRDEPPPIPSGVKVTIEPEERALEALAQHVRVQGRAFSLFDAARLVLAGTERHQVRFDCEAERLAGLFKVDADSSALFESREEALRYVSKNVATLATYYQEDEVELEEPKGNFNSVAVCGMSGELLGPPSHHSYQSSLKRLHAERFNHLPLEDYKRRVQVKNEPELVQQWKDQQRKGRRWTWLRAPSSEEQAPITFSSLAEVESHFRRHHADSAIMEVRTHIVAGNVRREQLSPGLGRLYRRVLEDTRKHLFDLSQRIAHGLEKRGLKLFKRRSGKLFVSRVKPRAIDPAVVFSARVTVIVEAIRKEPGIQAAKLLESLAPSPAQIEGQAPAERSLTDDQKSVIRDLRWLADEGYVIEYSDGPVHLGIQGDPPNAKPEAKEKVKPDAVADSAEAVSEEPEPATVEVEADAAVPATSATEELLPAPTATDAQAEASDTRPSAEAT
jgi:hypothetical protein